MTPFLPGALFALRSLCPRPCCTCTWRPRTSYCCMHVVKPSISLTEQEESSLLRSDSSPRHPHVLSLWYIRVCADQYYHTVSRGEPLSIISISRGSRYLLLRTTHLHTYPPKTGAIGFPVPIKAGFCSSSSHLTFTTFGLRPSRRYVGVLLRRRHFWTKREAHFQCWRSQNYICTLLCCI